MPKFRLMQSDFGRGELDPLLDVRSDIKAYRNGAKAFKNMSLKPQGSARRRPGTDAVYNLSALNPARPTFRLFAFVFSDDQRYLLVFSHGRLHIFDGSGTLIQILLSQPWTEDQLPRIYLDYSGDTIIVCHPEVRMRRILRTGATTFTSSVFIFEAAAGGSTEPQYKYADPEVTIDPGAITGSDIPVIASASYFLPAHVGNRIWHKGKMMTITEYVGPLQVKVTINQTLTDHDETAEWTEQVFNDVYGWARTVVFHDRRLIFGGSNALPDGFWGSKIDAPFNFDAGTGVDDDAIWAFIGSSRLNEIRSMVSGQHLQIMTNDGEFYVPASETRPITPENISFRRQTSFGSSIIPAVVFDGATIFFQNQNNVLREFLWQDTQQAYSSESVSLLSGHLVNDPVALASVFGGSAGQPDFFAVIVNGDGTMAQFQSLRSEEISGWAPWETQGLVKDACGLVDDLYLVVEREINGVDLVFLEKLKWEEEWTLDLADYYSNPTPQSIWTINVGYSGQEVHVVSGGLYLGTFTPSGATLDLGDIEVTEILIGFNYDVLIQPMVPDADLGSGPITGEVKRIVKTVLMLKDTRSVAVNGQPLILRRVSDDLSIPPEDYSGRKEFRVRGWGNAQNITINQPEPLKMTLLGIQLEVEIG